MGTSGRLGARTIRKRLLRDHDIDYVDRDTVAVGGVGPASVREIIFARGARLLNAPAAHQ
jgi:hypothetical protein